MSYNKLSADPSAMTLGIIGLVISVAGCCCGVFAVVAIILGAIGLIMANKSISEFAEHPDAYSQSSLSNVKTSRILNIISIVVGSLITFVYVIYFAFYGVLISAAMKEAYTNEYEYESWEGDSYYDDEDVYEIQEDTISIDSIDLEINNTEIKTDSINN